MSVQWSPYEWLYMTRVLNTKSQAGSLRGSENLRGGVKLEEEGSSW